MRIGLNGGIGGSPQAVYTFVGGSYPTGDRQVWLRSDLAALYETEAADGDFGYTADTQFQYVLVGSSWSFSLGFVDDEASLPAGEISILPFAVCFVGTGEVTTRVAWVYNSGWIRSPQGITYRGTVDDSGLLPSTAQEGDGYYALDTGFLWERRSGVWGLARVGVSTPGELPSSNVLTGAVGYISASTGFPSDPSYFYDGVEWHRAPSGQAYTWYASTYAALPEVNVLNDDVAQIGGDMSNPGGTAVRVSGVWLWITVGVWNFSHFPVLNVSEGALGQVNNGYAATLYEFRSGQWRLPIQEAGNILLDSFGEIYFIDVLMPSGVTALAVL